MDGPGRHSFETGLTKNFYVTETRYLQFRWEMFNAPNHVNLSAPTTTINLATTGKIFSAGGARQKHFGRKVIFLKCRLFAGAAEIPGPPRTHPFAMARVGGPKA